MDHDPPTPSRIATGPPNGSPSRRNGSQGVRRQKSVRTTIADPAAERTLDLVDRQFRVPTPNALVVADFTYVKLVTPPRTAT